MFITGAMFIHIGYFSCRPFSINRVCLTIQQKLVLLSHNGIIQKVHVNVTALSSPIYHKENPSFTTYLAQLHNRPFYSLWLAPPDWCNQLKTWGFHFIHQNPFVQHISTFFLFIGSPQQLASGSLAESDQTTPFHPATSKQLTLPTHLVSEQASTS